MGNQTLMTISGDMAAVLGLIDEAQGELNPTLEAWLAEIGADLGNKVDCYIGRVDGLEMMADVCRKRAKDATAAARTIENMQAQLEDRIKLTMNELGRNELQGTEWRYKLTATKGSLQINEGELPAAYTIQVTTSAPDKERVRAELDAGKLIPGATIKPGFQLRKYRATK